VTGATDGIGKAIAFELARKGCSIVLVSRSADKLADVKAELNESVPKVEVKCEVVDFSAFDEERRSQLAQTLDGLDVGVLVNNVGMSYPFCQWFHELSDAEVAQLLSINVDSATWMTRAVLPGMLRRKRGAVLNMSSAAAQSPLPLLAQYSAAKGYIVNFTRSLAAEYDKKGLHFQCQFPLWVATLMTFPNSKVPVDKRASLMVPTMKTYARAAVGAIGHEVMSCPYLPHAMYMWLAARIPDFVKTIVIMGMHKEVRFHKKNVALMEKKAKGA
jgi:17beta-estradiol 17-dehydrogenase / very-long-chain 3-oxoacyl-CoA reductase